MARLVEFFRHECGHALPVPGKAHEEETHPLFEIELGESHIGLLEPRKALLLGNAFQLAVEPVTPAVIGTNDLARAVPRLASHHPGSSVAADVVEGSEHTVPPPYHEDALAYEVHSQVVARPRYVARMANHQPVAPEDLLLLEFKELGVVVDPSGQGCEFFGLQILNPTRGGSRPETWRSPREFGGEDAAQKTSTRRSRHFEVEGPALTQKRFGQGGQHVVEGAAQGVGFEVRVATLRRDRREGLHPLLFQFGFPRRAHAHVIGPGPSLTPKSRPHRHPLGMAEFGVEGRVDHRLEASHRGAPVCKHRLALAEHVLTVHVFQGREQESILALEVEVHDARGESGAPSHPGHSGSREPMLGDAFDGGPDQFLASARVPWRLRRSLLRRRR